MAAFTWNDKEYSVGIRKMDEQHKQLIGLLNALHGQKNSGNVEFAEKVLATLVHYTKQHFVDEEKILKKIHFPHFDSHHLQHLRFIDAVNHFRAECDKHGTTPEILSKLADFLSEWLKHHILVEDMAYGTYLES